MRIINCEHCKQDFESERKKRFCSQSCRVKSKFKNHPTALKTCPGCSTEFSTSKPDKKWCSKKCADKVWAKNPKKKASIKAWLEAHPDKRREYDRIKRLNKRSAAPLSKPIYINTCKATGKAFVSRRRGTRYSPEGIAIRRRMQNYPSYRWPKSERNCFECDNPFIGTPKSKYCSKKCSHKHTKRITRLVERMKKKGVESIEWIDPIKVFNKYNWCCAICSRATPRSLLGTVADTAPSIDHILPISAGGHHQYDNIQLLCRQCNTAKGTLIDPSNETVQLISIHNKLNKQIYVTEQQLTRSA